jgi:hypothetical protein
MKLQALKQQALCGALMALLAGPTMAAPCTSQSNWGSLGPPGLTAFGNAFSSAGSYLDCYSFSLTSAANMFGGVLEFNTIFNKLDIDVSSVSLFSDGSLVGSDNSPLFFSFSSLIAGTTYTLAVQSIVSTDPGLWTVPVGYAGLTATSAAPVAAIPEPEIYAMMGIGLGFVGWLGRRRRLKEAA